MSNMLLKKVSRSFGLMLLSGFVGYVGASDGNTTVLSSIGNVAVPNNQVPDLKLVGVSFDSHWKCSGDYFWNDGDKIKIDVMSFNFKQTPYTAKVKFTLNDRDYNVKGNLEEITPIIHFPAFDPEKKDYADYLKQITNDEFSKQVKQHFCWSVLDNADVGDMGSPKLTFINHNKNHAVYPDNTPHYNCDKKDKITELQIKYRLDEKDPYFYHTLLRIDHEPVNKVDCLEIKYLDSSRYSQKITATTYSTVPKKFQERKQKLALPDEKYTTLVPTNNTSVLALHPTSEGFIKPEDNALNKYYRVGSKVEEPSNYIWTDGQNFYETKVFSQAIEEQDFPTERPEKVEFKNKDTQGSKLLISAEKASVPIRLPGGVVPQGGSFLSGYYYLNKTINTNNGLTQYWIEEPSSSNQPVIISINGIKIKDKWLHLDGFPDFLPQVKDNKIIFNLSTVLHKDVQFENLINYMTKALWLERKTPFVKYVFGSETSEECDKACKWLIQLIEHMNLTELELDEGEIIDCRSDTIWTLKPAHGESYLGKNGLTNYEYLVKFLEKKPTLQEINFGETFENLSYSSIILLSENEKIKTIPLAKFNIEDSYKLQLADEQIDKLLLKLSCVEKLELAGYPSEVRYGHLNEALFNNVKTLTHLDCSNIKDLGDRGDEFLEAVKYMHNLQVINVLGSGLSNVQITDFSQILTRHEKHLSEVHLDMPYCVSGGIDLTTQAIVDYKRSIAKLGLTEDTLLATLFSLPLGAVFFSIGTAVDLYTYHGPSFTDAFYFLNKIRNLKTLKLKLSHVIRWENYLSSKSDKIRKEFKLEKINIEFVK